MSWLSHVVMCAPDREHQIPSGRGTRTTAMCIGASSGGAVPEALRLSSDLSLFTQKRGHAMAMDGSRQAWREQAVRLLFEHAVTEEVMEHGEGPAKALTDLLTSTHGVTPTLPTRGRQPHASHMGHVPGYPLVLQHHRPGRQIRGRTTPTSAQLKGERDRLQPQRLRSIRSLTSLAVIPGACSMTQKTPY